MTEQLAIALEAVQRYAEMHPRPTHVTQLQAAEMLGLSQARSRSPGSVCNFWVALFHL